MSLSRRKFQLLLFRLTSSTDCDAYDDSNQGCGTSFPESNSYGTEFNVNAGGWYVMKRSWEGISIWFWPRNSTTVPLAVSSGSDNMTPDDSWDIPDATFPSTTCDYGSYFDAHQLVFNVALCVGSYHGLLFSPSLTLGFNRTQGDWAGSTFSSCGTGSCNDCKCCLHESLECNPHRLHSRRQ